MKSPADYVYRLTLWLHFYYNLQVWWSFLGRLWSWWSLWCWRESLMIFKKKKLNEKYIDMEQCKSNQCYNKILFSFRSFKNLSFFWNQRIIAVFCLFLVYTLQNLTFRPSFIYAYYDVGEHFFQLTFLFEIIFTAH